MRRNIYKILHGQKRFIPKIGEPFFETIKKKSPVKIQSLHKAMQYHAADHKVSRAKMDFLIGAFCSVLADEIKKENEIVVRGIGIFKWRLLSGVVGGRSWSRKVLLFT